MVAKVASDQAKPNGVLWVIPGREPAFLAPLDVRKIPGVGKVTEKNLHALGIRKVGDLARLDEDFLEQRFGKWGLAMAGKSRGLDAGGWYDTEIGADEGPKSISHEHTFSEDTADQAQIEATLSRLSEMVGRRLREQALHARTIQLKLRYSDFSTITRAHSVKRATAIDTELFEAIRELFRRNWKPGAAVRLVGVHVSSWGEGEQQMDLIGEDRHERWKGALAAADRMREKFGESAVSLAASLLGRFRERTHENPAGLPGKKRPGKSDN
jgi:DNA polymerase-4